MKNIGFIHMFAVSLIGFTVIDVVLNQMSREQFVGNIFLALVLSMIYEHCIKPKY